MKSTPFSRTDLSKKDKFHRLIHKIESRLLYFEQQCDFRLNSPYYHEYCQKLAEFKAHITPHLLLLHGVGNYFNYSKTKGTNEIIQHVNKKTRVYDDAYNIVKQWPDREAHIAEVLDINIEHGWKEPGDFDFVLDMMSESAFVKAVQTLKSRIRLQFTESLENRWYMVLGLLTVEPEYIRQIFETGSQEWRTYIRQLQREVEKEVYGSHRAAKRQPDCFHYLAVVEEGDLNGRCHIHVILWMKKAIPCADPNYGLAIPYKREIDEYEIYWPYGHSIYKAIRWSNSDSFGSDGWVWPVEDGQPIMPSHIEKLTNYLTNYIMKGRYNTKEYTWRTRCNHNMGRTKLNNVIRTMTTPQLHSLVKHNVYPSKIQLLGAPVPGSLIRDAALTHLIKRFRRRNLKALPKDTRLLTLLRTSTLKKRGVRSQNTGGILAQLFAGRDISSPTMRKNFYEAKNKLESAFPIPEEDYHVSGGKT